MAIGCGKMFEDNDIRRFGSKEIYQKYLQFKRNIDVDINPRLKWCPRVGCNRYVEKVSAFQKTATCECGERVCLKCGETSHSGEKCG